VAEAGIAGAWAGLLVLQPDVLLSGTRVAGSFKCARQAVLEERFGGGGSAKAVEGTLLHDLFQVRPLRRVAGYICIWVSKSTSVHLPPQTKPGCLCDDPCSVMFPKCLLVVFMLESRVLIHLTCI
jgi:hypothetical protein